MRFVAVIFLKPDMFELYVLSEFATFPLKSQVVSVDYIFLFQSYICPSQIHLCSSDAFCLTDALCFSNTFCLTGIHFVLERICFVRFCCISVEVLFSPSITFFCLTDALRLIHFVQYAFLSNTFGFSDGFCPSLILLLFFTVRICSASSGSVKFFPV